MSSTDNNNINKNNKRKSKKQKRKITSKLTTKSGDDNGNQNSNIIDELNDIVDTIMMNTKNNNNRILKENNNNNNNNSHKSLMSATTTTTTLDYIKFKRKLSKSSKLNQQSSPFITNTKTTTTTKTTKIRNRSTLTSTATRFVLNKNTNETMVDDNTSILSTNNLYESSQQLVADNSSTSSNLNEQQSPSSSSTKSSLKPSSTTSSSSISKHVKFLNVPLCSPVSSTTSSIHPKSTSTTTSSNSEYASSTRAVYGTSSSNCCTSSDAYNETPMMFSRCSSLGSLNSFDIKSIHSSVASEYSRRQSGIYTPGDIPDSPNQQQQQQHLHQTTFISNETAHLSTLTVDSNPISNEITIIERTLLNRNSNENSGVGVVALNTTQTSLFDNDLMKTYNLEDSPWHNNSREESMSNISSLNNYNNNDQSTTNDYKAIINLLSKKSSKLPIQQQTQLNFTPPVKLEYNKQEMIIDQPKQYTYENTPSDLSPTSQLSVPSIIGREQQRQQDQFLVNSQLFPSVINRNINESDKVRLFQINTLTNDDNTSASDISINHRKPFNTPVNNYCLSNESSIEDEDDDGEEEKKNEDNIEIESKNESKENIVGAAYGGGGLSKKDDTENDDDKILFDFINQMLPIVNQREKLQQSNASILTTSQTHLSDSQSDSIHTESIKKKKKKVPIVNMTKTTQLRVIKAQKMKQEMNKKTTESSFKSNYRLSTKLQKKH